MMSMANCAKCGTVFVLQEPVVRTEFYYCRTCGEGPTGHVYFTADKPGIYDEVSPADYHADCCPEPSLSSSIAKLLCLSSPAHARFAHPRLNPQAVQEEAEKFDIGTAAHAIILEGEAAVEIIDAPDWRTKLAKEQRDKARLAGKTPLLAKVWADVQAMVVSVRTQLEAHEDGREMFKNGKPEQTLIWQEPDGTWCRARADWLRPGAIDDLKTTSGSANPDSWTRTMFSMGFDIQVAWYLRGLKALTGEDAIFRFAVVETEAPFALSVIGLGPDAMMLAEKKIQYALETWRRCLDEDDWPAYPKRTCWASLPAWHETWWLETKEGGLR
jgi:hypothetical protein